ncbi:hypothetical protein [Streptococcus pneumoniae]|uniref:hypothetical protein n=1 Tax=Streptococcus pneumoniae TaxID=1313 RepID=UPI000B3EF06E|nr:hypothetical protein [Streptococcus pneumoniae]MBZ8009134.1 hypothetical protein [Streptococcus pneumoniae]MBZ8019148.1 hypothetical protein [Streptococcus pneumoniae]MBZ8044935.1 hypothetical protein [Streptococcus pneumoniae]MBZ8049339.1 hypothetical protein [Streptococcus pneumoniae]MBZ8051395.1 hypothetical protein [Streptococcus pneumoniae]
MTVILGFLFLFLMTWWVISIVNSQKPRKNETFIGYIQRNNSPLTCDNRLSLHSVKFLFTRMIR